MAEFKIDGRMKVKKLKELFKDEYQGTLRVYNGGKLADEEATLASIRNNDGAKGGTLTCRASRTVGKFIEDMWETFGIKIKVASPDDWVLALDGITLSKLKDIPNNAKKSDMEALIAYKRDNNNIEETIDNTLGFIKYDINLKEIINSIEGTNESISYPDNGAIFKIALGGLEKNELIEFIDAYNKNKDSNGDCYASDILKHLGLKYDNNDIASLNIHNIEDYLLHLTLFVSKKGHYGSIFKEFMRKFKNLKVFFAGYADSLYTKEYIGGPWICTPYTHLMDLGKDDEADDFEIYEPFGEDPAIHYFDSDSNYGSRFYETYDEAEEAMNELEEECENSEEEIRENEVVEVDEFTTMKDFLEENIF